MTKKQIEKRRDKYYIRVYAYDWLLNGITKALTKAEQLCWLRLQLLSVNHNPAGSLPIAPDPEHPFDELAFSIHSRPSTVESAIKKLALRGKVSLTDTTIIITNWGKEQPELQTRFPGKDWDKTKGSKTGQPDEDPDKFVKGKYGHMVRR